jgi:steroid delta-isomerase-like uncharacterized protein
MSPSISHSVIELNKALSRRFNDEVKNGHRLAAIDELLDADFVNHSEIPGFPSTREGVKSFFGYFIGAFPDLKCTVHDVVAEGDKVVDYFTLSGSHQGEFMGIPATGKHVEFQGMHIFAMRNGRITDHWNVLDLMCLMTQLGGVPAA